MKWIINIAFAALAACGHSPEPPSRQPASTEVPDTEAMGRALAERGRYREAGFYFEAAIAGGADERTVLPLLISAQIHSNRLRAAKRNALRMRELIGNEPSLEALIAALNRYTPELGISQQQEVIR